MELALSSVPGMSMYREQAVIEGGKGAGVAVGIAVVSGVVGSQIGAGWSTWLYVVSSLGAGYYLSEKHPILGAVVGGAGAITAFAMAIQRVAKWIKGVQSGAGLWEGSGTLGDNLGKNIGENLPVFEPYKMVG